MNSKKRIVFISPYGHHGAQSGAKHRVEALCRALLASNQDLHIICLSPWSPPAGVEHIHFSLEGSILKRLTINIWMFIRIGQLRPDLVISESPIAPVSFRRFEVLHVIHDAKFVTPFARRGAFLARWLHWISARISDKVVTVSNAEKHRISNSLNILSSRVVVSYNGLSDVWFSRPLPEPGALRQYDLLYVSNFAPHKGHLSLLEALRDCSFKIAFVGADFGVKEKCVELASAYGMDVTFMSNLTEKELISVYDDSKVFIFPSRLEGFGIPFLEARVRGLPVLAHDIPVFRELRGVIGGEVIDFNDNSLLIEKIRILLCEVPTLVSFELDKFRWEYIAQELIEEG